MVINGGLSNVWKNRADTRDDWWSGAPSWFLGGDRRRLRLFMEAKGSTNTWRFGISNHGPKGNHRNHLIFNGIFYGKWKPSKNSIAFKPWEIPSDGFYHGSMGDLQYPKMEVLYHFSGHMLWGYLKLRPKK